MVDDKEKMWEQLSRKPLIYEGIDFSFLYNAVSMDALDDATIEFSKDGERHRVNIQALIDMNKG